MRQAAEDSAVASADLNLRLLRHLARYLTDHHTAREVETVAQSTGISVAELVTGNGWVSLHQFEALLAGARGLMPDDATFMTACAYGIDTVRSPMHLLLSAISPATAYQLGARNMGLISRISTFEPKVVSRSRVRIGYRTTKHESRLMCLSRQAQIRSLPTLWALPPAHIVETACVARGDDCCAYDVRLYVSRRWAPLVFGTALALALGAALQFGFSVPVTWWWGGIFGAVLGYIYELRRTSAANLRTQQEITAAYLEIAHNEANARCELFAVTQRQRTWDDLMQHDFAGRKVALLRLAEELSELGRKRDPSQPTARIRSHVNKLRESGLARREDDLSSLSVIDSGLDELDRRLTRAARLATHASGCS